MSIGWNFPSNNFGKIMGISESGIETFRGSLFKSLAREICQNSLDARADFSKPVHIEFSLTDVDKRNICGFTELNKAIELCRDYWNENEKTLKFFNNAIKICNKEKIRVMRISDFNTTGLPGSKEFKSSPWQNLVKSSGVSDKCGGSGGSYGIGKSAPFACSDLRTVYYSTLDNEGIKAYQGVANLVSFKLEDKIFKKGEVTQGTGYFGEKSDNSAVEQTLSFDQFVRNECGTDLFILGFIESDEWKDEITKSVLEGYLISILNNDISVKVGDILIDNLHLDELMEKYKSEISLTYNYYQVLISKDTIHIEENFHDLGKISLYVLIHNDFQRKVLMARKNGMKIFDKKNISSTIQFAGVCVLEDEKINSYFREMETPQHNDWEPDRHSNRKEAKKMKTALFKFIKEKIISIGKETVTDEMDAIGAGEIIPDFNTDISQNVSLTEYIDNEVKDFTVVKRDTVKIEKGTQVFDEENLNSYDETLGRLDEEGEFDSEKFVHNNGKKRGNNSDSKEGKGIIDTNGNVNINMLVSVKTLKMRLFLNDIVKKTYHLSFQPEESAKNAYVEILMTGEQVNLKANIKFATLNNNNLICSQNMIFIGDIEKNEKYTVTFSLDYDELCSMGVLVHGYKI